MATNITGVTMPQPVSDPGISPSGSFTMGGQITIAGGGGWAESGDMYFEWDQGTSTWVTMGSTGALNVAAQTNPITGLQTVTEQTVTVYNDGTMGSFQVRVKLIEDDLTTHTTTPVAVVVSGEAYSGPAAISGNGTVSSTGIKGGKGSPSISEQGNLTASGTVTLSGSADVSGGGSITASGATALSGSALISGNGSITASGSVGSAEEYSGSAVISGAGALSSSGKKSTSFGVTLTSFGSLVVSGIKQALGLMTISATGLQTASGTKAGQSPVDLSGTGMVGADGVKYTTGNASISGGGSITASSEESGDIKTIKLAPPRATRGPIFFDPDIIIIR